MREFAVAVSFLTRFEAGVPHPVGAAEVGRAARWFPVVGLLLGAAHVATWKAFDGVFGALLGAISILIVDALVTGGLHLDGLADTADGFGGGWTRTQVLDIMRDHAIGAYGALALILVLGARWAAIAEILDRPGALGVLLAAPTLSRWSGVTQGWMFPYARESRESTGAAVTFIGGREWVFATVVTIAVVLPALGPNGAFAFAGALAVALAWGRICHRRIQGVTGDTVGAGVAMAEVVVLLTGVAL